MMIDFFFDIFRSTPVLELHDVTVRIARINDPESANSFEFIHSDVADGASTGVNDSGDGLVHVIDAEGDVPEPRLVRLRRGTCAGRIVRKDFQGRTRLSLTWKKQGNAAERRFTQPSHAIQPLAGIIPIRSLRDAPENVAVKAHQLF